MDSSLPLLHFRVPHAITGKWSFLLFWGISLCRITHFGGQCLAGWRLQMPPNVTKKTNAQSSAPLDASYSLPALEESQFSSLRGGEATSSFAIEGSSSQPLKTTATVHISGSSQVSSPTRQKDQTVVQMDTDI